MFINNFVILVSGEISNLVRMRNSMIGKSAPSLSVHMVSINCFSFNFRRNYFS